MTRAREWTQRGLVALLVMVSVLIITAIIITPYLPGPAAFEPFLRGLADLGLTVPLLGVLPFIILGLVGMLYFMQTSDWWKRDSARRRERR